MTPRGITEAPRTVELFDRAAKKLRDSPTRSGSAVRLPGRGRLLVTGDLHDNPMNLRTILGLARLDESPDHHVVLHEIIHSERLVNGVDLSHRMLVRVAELIIERPGQVHLLLANHELAQMLGQGVTKGAGNSVELFNHGLEFVFGDDCETVAEAINGFIRALPLALVSESGVLCAHSLPSPRTMKSFDLDVLDRELGGKDYEPGTGSAYLMVWGRGYDEAEIGVLAEHWGVTLFCLGHDHVDKGITMRGQKVIVLNSDHEMGTVVPIELGNVPSAEEALLHAIRLRSVGGLQ